MLKKCIFSLARSRSIGTSKAKPDLGKTQYTEIRVSNLSTLKTLFSVRLMLALIVYQTDDISCTQFSVSQTYISIFQTVDVIALNRPRVKKPARKEPIEYNFYLLSKNKIYFNIFQEIPNETLTNMPAKDWTSTKM